MICFEITTEIFCLLFRYFLALLSCQRWLRALVFSKHRAGLSH